MGTSQLLLGVGAVALYVFLWIGAPILVVGWLRRRREEMATRQIAVTDAIDGRLGMIVSPTVKKPLWGPWQIEIAAPLARAAAMGRILAATHEAVSGMDRMGPDQYRIVLTPTEDSLRKKKKSRRSDSAKPWLGNVRATA